MNVERTERRDRSDAVPEGYRAVILRAYTDGREVVIPEQDGFRLPAGDPVEGDHSCDELGCGWYHILARFRLPRAAVKETS